MCIFMKPQVTCGRGVFESRCQGAPPQRLGPSLLLAPHRIKQQPPDLGPSLSGPQPIFLFFSMFHTSTRKGFIIRHGSLPGFTPFPSLWNDGFSHVSWIPEVLLYAVQPTEHPPLFPVMTRAHTSTIFPVRTSHRAEHKQVSVVDP